MLFSSFGLFPIYLSFILYLTNTKKFLPLHLFKNMALILNIETSTQVCSVNLAKDGKKLIGKETNEPNAHSKVLTVFIEDIFSSVNHNINDIDAVAVSKGPGSYTGLRIGVSVAKGIAYAGEKKLLSVNTLQNMAWGAKQTIQMNHNIIFAPVIDARRMEVYTQIFDYELNPISKIQALIVDETGFSDLLNNRKVCIFGDGAEKCKAVLNRPNINFLDHMNPSADYMIPFSESAFNKGLFEDIAYFEPFYLKDFVAIVPTKNIFG